MPGVNLTMDTGDDTAFAATVNAGRDPSPQHIENLAAAVEQQASVLRTSGDTSCSVHKPRLARALEGQAGEAQIVVHDANVHLWDSHADLYEQSGRALRNALGELYGLKHDLRLLIEEKEPQYNAALRRGDATGAQGILTDTLTEADRIVAARGGRAEDYVKAVNFTAPIPERPVTEGGGSSGDRKRTTDGEKNNGEESKDGAKSGDQESQGQPGDRPRTDLPNDTNPLQAAGPPTGANSDRPRTDLPSAPIGHLPSAVSQLGTVGGAGSGAGGLTGLEAGG